MHPETMNNAHLAHFTNPENPPTFWGTSVLRDIIAVEKSIHDISFYFHMYANIRNMVRAVSKPLRWSSFLSPRQIMTIVRVPEKTFFQFLAMTTCFLFFSVVEPSLKYCQYLGARILNDDVSVNPLLICKHKTPYYHGGLSFLFSLMFPTCWGQNGSN